MSTAATVTGATDICITHCLLPATTIRPLVGEPEGRLVGIGGNEVPEGKAP
jgi:hypothetical protein